MIRIDEIYETVFWKFLNSLPKPSRMFYFSPFGRTDPDSLNCFHNGLNNEHNYVVLFDQEPLDFNRHDISFSEVQRRCQNLYPAWPLRLPSTLDTNPILITSEKANFDTVKICCKYGYLHLHYFFHGWAALDWFRGYNRSFLIAPPESRNITKTFIMPNRIIGGERSHRIIMMYHIIKNNLLDNHISFPRICPVEHQSINDLTSSLAHQIPDIQTQFGTVNLPLNFDNETDHPMHSYQLSLFDQCQESLLYLVSETVANGSRIYLTEKTFKPICLQMPFILIAGAGSLEYLRSYGFKTFNEFWDEDYDHEEDDLTRFKKIAEILAGLNNLGIRQKQQMYTHMRFVLEHNYNHFYHGGFESVLWNELRGLLNVL